MQGSLGGGGLGILGIDAKLVFQNQKVLSLLISPAALTCKDLRHLGSKHSPNPFVVPRFIGAGQRNPLVDRMNAVTTNGLGECLLWEDCSDVTHALRLVGVD